MSVEMDTLGPTWLIGVYLGLVGLVVGSWLAGVAAAATTEAPCATCSPTSAWRRRWPVLSWGSAVRECAACDHPGHPERPAIELVTAGLFAALTITLYGNASPWVILAVLWSAAAGVLLAAIDLRVMLLPDRIIFPSMAAVTVLLAAAALEQGDLWPLGRALIGGVVLFAGYFIVAMISPKGMGFGDVKLAGLLGILLAWFGWPHLAVGAILPYVIGVIGVFGAIAFRPRRSKAVPFGPAMVAGALLAVAFGADISSWWMSIFETSTTL